MHILPSRLLLTTGFIYLGCMTLREVISDLGFRVDAGRLVDADLRSRVISQYEDGTLDGIPSDAEITVRFEQPRSEKKLKKQLRKLDGIATTRWGIALPQEFVRLYIDHGWPVVTISWDEDGEQMRAGCGFSSASEILRCSWVTEPALVEAHPDGSSHEIFHPLIPFMDVDSSEPVAFGFRHSPERTKPSVEWVTPGCFEETETGLAFSATSTPIDFPEWFWSWVESGFPPHGAV